MSVRAMAMLNRELGGLRVRDDESLLEYVALASRLAALGEPQALRKWPLLEKSLAERNDFPAALARRCREGIWDLQQCVCEDTAFALIDAQDFHCFHALEGDILPGEARRMLSAWSAEAEETMVDNSGREVLHEYLAQFPLPAELRLAAVATPLTQLEIDTLASLAPPRRTLRFAWPLPPVAGPSLHELCSLDAGAPSDATKRHFERLDTEIRVGGVGGMQLSRRLSDAWEVVLDVELESGAPTSVERVRIGCLPAVRVTVEPRERWVADLQPLEESHRRQLLQQPVVFAFENGFRVVLE